MFTHSGRFSISHEPPLQAGEVRLRWLRATRQLDVMSPRLTKQVMGLTQVLRSEREKAVALHDFVKGMPFSFVTDFTALTASDVLHQGYGDCFTKGMLLVAMMRAAKIPARLRFISIPVDFWYGIIEPQADTTMHAMTEVLLDGQWRVTDSYVPDTWLQTGARNRLMAEGRKMGYGVHIDGTQLWDGTCDVSAQCCLADTASMPLRDWGVADDPVSFYENTHHASLRRNFADRLKRRLAVPSINKRVAQVRSSATPQSQAHA
jgi:hypothetical protein